MTNKENIKHPTTCVVHWPTGPIAVCDKHRNGLMAINNALGGMPIAITKLTDTDAAECSNCINEVKASKSG